MTPRLRRASIPIGVAVILGLGLPSVSAAGSASTAVLVIDGKGNGHGVGMAQDGALAMGRAGDDSATILDRFYPGTTVSSAGGNVGVRVFESDATRVELELPGGGEVRVTPSGPQPTGFPVVVEAGGRVVVSREQGRFRVEAERGDEDGPVALSPLPLQLIADESEAPPSSSTTAVPQTTTTTTAEPEVVETDAAEPVPTLAPAEAPPPTTVASDEGLVVVPAAGSTTALPSRQRAYRGVLEVGASSLGGVMLVNRLDVEDYLKGMGEVLDPSWPPAALEAQAVAARTYALRAVATGGTLCDDDRCQVYVGAEVEYPAMSQAVDDTAGRVRLFGGGLASTVYSASAGGVTGLPLEGFGTDSADYPYLVSGPYLTDDPVPWASAIPLADLGPLLGYHGRVSGASVSAAGPSGRALEVTIDGDSGPLVVDGLSFAARLDLQSTLFSLGTGQGAARRAVAQPAVHPIQALPDQVATLRPLVAVPEPGRSPFDRAMLSIVLLAGAAVAGRESRRRRRRLGS